MLFQIAKWIEFVSAFAVLLPVFSIYYYLIIKSGRKLLGNDIVIASTYSIFSFFIQSIIVITSLKGLHNLWLFHGFIAVELFFFALILLNSIDISNLLAPFLGLSCYILAKTFDDPNKLPYLSVLIQFFSILLLAPNSIIGSFKYDKIDSHQCFYKDYLIKAILITTIGNFVFVSFLEDYLILILFVHSILNIYSNLLFSQSYKCYSETVL